MFSPQKMEGGTFTFKRMARETSSGRPKYLSTLLLLKMTIYCATHDSVSCF